MKVILEQQCALFFLRKTGDFFMFLGKWWKMAKLRNVIEAQGTNLAFKLPDFCYLHIYFFMLLK